MSTIDPEAFAALQQQVAALQAELARFKKHLYFEHAEPGEPTLMNISCNLITATTIVLQDEKHALRAMFTGRENDSSLTLFDRQERPRIQLSVDEDGPMIEIREEDGEPSVQIFSDEGHGCASVFSSGGIPRALMKGTEHGGAVSVVAPSGQVRALLYSDGEKGEVVIVNQDLNTAVKIASTPTGGCMMLNNAEGNPIFQQVVGPDGHGVLFINHPDGRQGVLLAAAEKHSLFQLNGGPGDLMQCGVSLMAMPGGGSISLRDAQGKDVVDLLTTSTGGSLHVAASQGDAAVSLAASEKQAQIAILDPAGRAGVFLCNNTTGGLISVKSPGTGTSTDRKVYLDRNGFTLCKEKIVGTLSFDDEENPLLAVFKDGNLAGQMSTYADGGSLAVYNNDGIRQVAMIAGGEGGQLGIFGDLGTDRVTLQAKDDGGQLYLRWGGTQGVVLTATEHGGAVIVCGDDGKPTGCLPKTLGLNGDDYDGD